MQLRKGYSVNHIDKNRHRSERDSGVKTPRKAEMRAQAMSDASRASCNIDRAIRPD